MWRALYAATWFLSRNVTAFLVICNKIQFTQILFLTIALFRFRYSAWDDAGATHMIRSLTFRGRIIYSIYPFLYAHTLLPLLHLPPKPCFFLPTVLIITLSYCICKDICVCICIWFYIIYHKKYVFFSIYRLLTTLFKGRGLVGMMLVLLRLLRVFKRVENGGRFNLLLKSFIIISKLFNNVCVVTNYMHCWFAARLNNH